MKFNLPVFNPKFVRDKSVINPLVDWFVYGPYAFLIRMLVFGLLTLSLSRILMLIWQSDRVAETGMLWDVLIQGVRADIVLMSFGLVIPVLLSAVLAYRWTARYWFTFSYYWALLWLIFVVFMELATPSYIMQYDVRPDRIFVEYLKYPKEVLSTLWGGFKVPVILGLVLAGVFAYLYARYLKIPADKLRMPPFWMHIIIWPLLAVLIAMGIRSTLGHRAVNPAFFAITSDSLINSLVINSAYSMLFDIYIIKDEANSSEIYGKISTDKMLELNKNWPWLQTYKFNNPDYPTYHLQEAQVKRDKPLNVVIVLQESMGATFVESLGGLPMTPGLEKLKEQGIWFENLYATGTRSVRGIEAVVAGFMPTPAQSTVKLSLSQKNFTTIASILKNQGYHTSFMYGGEAHFDNMRSYFTGNGITEVIDEPHIKTLDKDVFIASWGASDEDLFTKAHIELERMHQDDKPFFSLIFTSSNHEPFDFPEGRIELYEQPQATVNNAVKYADWAMYEFFQKAQASDYWKDTVFLIVADHDNRVYGSNLIPLEKFKIPGLILGADVQPERIKSLASQIDLAPTLLSYAGISSCHPMMGRDFNLDKTSKGRALVQFGNVFGLMEEVDDVNNTLSILTANHKTYLADYSDKERVLHLQETQDEQVRKKALAHVHLPSYLYREQKYLSNLECP